MQNFSLTSRKPCPVAFDKFLNNRKTDRRRTTWQPNFHEWCKRDVRISYHVTGNGILPGLWYGEKCVQFHNDGISLFLTGTCICACSLQGIISSTSVLPTSVLHAEEADNRNSKCRPRNRKWKLLLIGNRWQSDPNGYQHIFDHARLKYGTADAALH